MKRSVAVTGATGFLGSHLTRRLLRDGHQVAVLVREAARLDQLQIAPHRVVQGDIRDAKSVARLMQGVEVCFHLVSNFRATADPPAAYESINVHGTRLAVEAAAAVGVRRFIHCSTIGVHGHVRVAEADESTAFNPGDRYQRTKLAAELLVRNHAGQTPMEIVVVRPCSLYGPGDLRMLKMFRMLVKGRFLMLGSGKSHFHAAYIDDVVDGFTLAMSSPRAAGEVFILGGPEHLPLRDYIDRAARAAGVPAPRLRLPYWMFFAASAVVEASCLPLGIDPPLTRRRVRFFRNHRAFRIDKARRLLGYEPQVGLDEGLRLTAQWYREQGWLPGDTTTEQRVEATSRLDPRS